MEEADTLILTSLKQLGFPIDQKVSTIAQVDAGIDKLQKTILNKFWFHSLKKWDPKWTIMSCRLRIKNSESTKKYAMN